MSQAHLDQLTHVVQCRDGRPFFETIAAFNVDRAAAAYATECYMANVRPGRSIAYRVVDIATGQVIHTWGSQ